MKTREDWNKYYAKNKDKIKEKRKIYLNVVDENGFKAPARHALKAKYGMSVEDFLKMKEKQNNVCAICKSVPTKFKKRDLFVDHNHNTNAVRGLLCFACNSILGYCYEDIEILKNTIKYLKKYDKKNAS